MSTDNSAPIDTPRTLVKSTSIISVGTLSSRILGFFRDIILANFFGTGIQADAFFVAFRIPNLFRSFVGEGATNSAIVPVLSEISVQKDRKEFWNFVSVLAVLAMVILSGIVIVGIGLAPWIVRLIAPGFMADSHKLQLTVTLTKMMFPYLLLIGLTAYSMSILYTFRSFAAPAFSPCLLNIAIIASALISSRVMDEPIFGLAWGVLIGGALQFLIQVPFLWKRGWRPKRPPTLRHPDAVRVGRLLGPRVFGAGVYQLNVFIDTFCASLVQFVGVGGISAIYYANRLVQFPMGIFGFAIASAVLPSMSELAAQKDNERFRATLSFALENLLFILIPAGVLLMTLGMPIIRILFQRGEFTSYSTGITTSALFFYSIGLFAFGGMKIMITAFHAMQDTKTPVKVAAACLLINVILNFLLMGPMKIGGIALASSIAATVNFVRLFHLMQERIGDMGAELSMFVGKILGATLLMFVFCYGIGYWSWQWFPWDVVNLALVLILSLIVYLIACYFWKVPQAKTIFQFLQNLGRPAKS